MHMCVFMCESLFTEREKEKERKNERWGREGSSEFEVGKETFTFCFWSIKLSIQFAFSKLCK